MDGRAFSTLVGFLERIPAVQRPVITSERSINVEGWWVSFRVDIHHPLAWSVIHEMGYALNGADGDASPVLFGPSSLGPWLGPTTDTLSWLIRSWTVDHRPGTVANRLEEALPSPVDDEASWPVDEEPEDDW